MTQQTTRVRIYSHVTQSKFLHVEDSLAIGKLRLFAGTYRRGHGMDDHAQHYIDLPDARVILLALAHVEPALRYREYKGTPPRDGQPAVSRSLSVAVKADDVYIELKQGAGKLTATGAITPAGQPTVSINVAFKLHAARRLAATVGAYVQAWDVYRMMQHKQQVGSPARFESVPTTQVASAEPHPIPQAQPSAQVRPKTNKTTPRLRYADGTLVATDNAIEVQTFGRYRHANGSNPPSRLALQTFYRQQLAV